MPHVLWLCVIKHGKAASVIHIRHLMKKGLPCPDIFFGTLLLQSHMCTWMYLTAALTMTQLAYRPRVINCA